MSSHFYLETDFDSLMFIGEEEQTIVEHCNFVEWGAMENECKKLVSKKVYGYGVYVHQFMLLSLHSRAFPS